MSEQQNWLPELDESSRPFFEGAARGELCLQVCDQCENWMMPVKKRCTGCGGSELSWRTASGRGILYGHAQLHRVYHARHKAKLPMVVWIDLEEGVRIYSNLVAGPDVDVKTGMAVQVEFEHFPDGGIIPVFRPLEP